MACCHAFASGRTLNEQAAGERASCQAPQSSAKEFLVVCLLPNPAITTYGSQWRTPMLNRICLAYLVAYLCAAAAPARADDLSCVSTTFRLIGKNDRVCVSAFDDPKVAGVACHISQARTGGLSGTIGLAEDPSRFSIACRQVGPIHVDLASLTDREEVYSARTSVFFKRTHVYRVLDKTRNTLVYLAISDKLIEGSPQNAISTVPIMPWATGR
jgi:CreA protein